MSLDFAGTVSPVRTVKLLIVDDEPDIRRLYTSLLDDRGFEVTEAATAKEGARAALRGVFDVAVIDERLPDNRGTALVRWLRRRFPGMKLVLFSAYADWDLFFRASGCGARDVVAKDLPRSELLRVVKHSL